MIGPNDITATTVWVDEEGNLNLEVETTRDRSSDYSDYVRDNQHDDRKEDDDD